MQIVETIKQHPYIAGAAVFGIGFLWLMSRGSNGASSTDAGLAGAYYGAIAADKTAAAQMDIAHTNATAAVAINQQNTTAATTIQGKWADTSLATVQAQSDAATAIAPYALQGQYIATLGAIASQPGTVTTKTSSGFFGIGGGSKQVYTPNPNAAAATSLLANYDPLGFITSH